MSEDPNVRAEEEAAAEEAAAIGGEGPDYEGDEASRPLEEAGQGVAEGFEQSEQALAEEGHHGDQRFNPERNELTPERESDLATGAEGDADDLDPEH
jgi:hypothetical protein